MRIFTFNTCVHWERNGKGRYAGVINSGYLGHIRVPGFELLPWYRNDGDHGFFEWLIFRFGWYPVRTINRGEQK